MKTKFIITLSAIASFILSCKTSYNIQNVEKNQISINSSIQENQEIADIIKPYKTKLDNEMNRVLTYNPIELHKNGANFPLGIFVTDIIMNEAQERYPDKKIDAVLMNTGGLRRTFTPGNLTVRSIFELMPFENELVLVTLSADKFKEMVEFLNKSNMLHPISGLSFHKGSDDLDIRINGEPFDPNRDYNVVTNDYLEKGGDNMTFFLNSKKAEYFDLRLRDLFIDKLEKIDTIKIDTTTPRYILN